MSLSVLILTFNSERTLEKCLRSVSFSPEIVVVDSGSKDKTLDIARKYTSRIYQHPYKNYGDQINWALEKLTGEWVLVVDSDEEVSPPLREEIQGVVKEGEMDGYYIPRKSEFMGKWLNFIWRGDKVLRLFRKGKAVYRERELGSSPVVEGRVGRLKNFLLHHPYRDIAHYLEKMNYYTTCAAREIRKKGRVNILDILLRPPLRFFRVYLIKGGIFDGFPGLIMAILSSFYVFLKYLKAWEKG